MSAIMALLPCVTFSRLMRWRDPQSIVRRPGRGFRAADDAQPTDGSLVECLLGCCGWR